jgi:hypothetical protein
MLLIASDPSGKLPEGRSGGLCPPESPFFLVFVVGEANHEHQKNDLLRGSSAPEPPLVYSPAVSIMRETLIPCSISNLDLTPSVM